jgi:hypothetical protein
MAPLLAVLGMHRSGTSATLGTIQRYGVEVGPVSEKNTYNPRGNRELRRLVKLHDQILERNGGSWWRPPEEITITPDDYGTRDAVLTAIPGSPVAVKDPRMLLLIDFWRDLEPMWIGVIRNPVAVRQSLERREGKDRKLHLDGEEWEALWCHYNRALLAELERVPFPVIDFDRGELDAQVRTALDYYDIEPQGDGGFFAQELVHERPDAGWRGQALSSESVELWERLAARVAVPR